MESDDLPTGRERRATPRRSSDRAIDDLQATFSTSRCRACLKHLGDGVILLDSQTRVLYTTPAVHQSLKNHAALLSLAPAFTLHEKAHARRFAAFVGEESRSTQRCTLLLDDTAGRDPLLLSCFRLPPPSTHDLNAARFLLILRDPERHSRHQWNAFEQHFQLTPKEGRLAQSLADGLSLADYSHKARISANTARSQLKSIFAKTFTRRQSDLLRLIYLFTRL